MFCGWLIEKRKGTPPPQPYAPKPETVPQQHAPKSETSRPREFPIGDDESSDFGRQKDIARKIWRDQAPAAEASREKQEWERQAEERIRQERVDAEQRLGNPGYSDDVVQRMTRQQQEEEDQERDKRRRRSRGR